MGNPISDFGNWLTRRPGEQQQRSGLLNQATAASNFANQGQAGYGALGSQLGDQADYLRRTARGENSVSAEQLRQGLGRVISGQQSMAASAAPRDAAMAGLVASRNAANAGSAMAGQQALAGIQERDAAQQALGRLLLEQRAQDMNVALGSRNAATGAYGQVQPGQSWLDRFGGAVMGAGQLYAMGGRGGQGR